MSAPDVAEADRFQPGQLGIRHLLGLMTLASIVLAVSAVRLRNLSRLQIALVGWHWAVVLAIVSAVFYVRSRRLRADRIAAGEVLLRAYSRPVRARRREVAKWALTVLVILDGIFISLALYPSLPVAQQGVAWSKTYWAAFLLNNIVPQNAIMEGMLWSWCLSHWLTNVDLIEFRQHGLLLGNGYGSYFPWDKIGRPNWSSAHRGRLVFFHRRHVVEIPIEQEAREAVSAVLERVGRKSVAEIPRTSERAPASVPSSHEARGNQSV